MLQDPKKLELLEISSKYQENLYEETVTVAKLAEACRYLNQDSYVEIVEERSANKLCGYPICSNSLQNVKGYKINRKYGLLNTDKHKDFCGMNCFIASEFLKGQISPEPLHFRNINNQSFDIIPVGVDPEAYLENLNDSQQKEEPVEKVAEQIREISFADIKIVEKDEQMPLNYEPCPHDNIEGYTIKKVSFASSTKKEKQKKVLTNENWLEPEKNTAMPILSKFGKIVNFLNEIITFNTKEYILNQKAPKISDDYDDQQRKSIFCQKILHQITKCSMALQVDSKIDQQVINIVNTFRLNQTNVMIPYDYEVALSCVLLELFGTSIKNDIEEVGIGSYEFKVYVGLFK